MRQPKTRWAIIGVMVAVLAVVALLWWRGVHEQPRPHVGSASQTEGAGAPAPRPHQGPALEHERSPHGSRQSRRPLSWSREAVEQRRQAWLRRRKAVQDARARRVARAPVEGDDVEAEREGQGSFLEQIKEEMAAIRPLLLECYQNAMLDAGPELQGTLTLTYTIGGEPSVGGVVEEVEIDEESSDELKHNPSLAQCVTATMYTLEFDEPPVGGKVIVTAPLTFTRRPEDEPASESP